MYSRHSRSDRRSGDLYQSVYHRRIKERQEAALAVKRALTLEELRERAKEANRHACEQTFIHPSVLLELLEYRDRLDLYLELIDLHQEMALKEPKNHVKRDSMLWAQCGKTRYKRRE